MDIPQEFIDMANGYIGCALWAGQDWSNTTDHGGTEDNPEPWDKNYDSDDLSFAAMIEAVRVCAEFIEANREDLNKYHPDGPNPEQWGHDFYLTRNHHGAGFWDRYYGDDDEMKKAGRRLTEAAHVYGEIDFYVNEDGKLEWNK
jgi:hypothetical protein